MSFFFRSFFHKRQEVDKNAKSFTMHHEDGTRISVVLDKRNFYVQGATEIPDLGDLWDDRKMLKMNKKGGVYVSWGIDIEQAWKASQLVAGWGE